jgi:hypothetical protein
MSRLILLDANTLGLATNPGGKPDAQACAAWIEALLQGGDRVLAAEIADYEIRRELLRARKLAGVARLDRWRETGAYVPLTTEAMLLAATFWAEARQQGRPTAPDLALDGDVILAGQAEVLRRAGNTVIVATDNVRHLARFTDARRWQEIQPTAPPP